MRRSPVFRLLLLACAALPGATPLCAQRLLERSPNLPNGVSALPGVLEMALPHRFRAFGGARGLETSTTFDLALGLPLGWGLDWTSGIRFAPSSDVVPDESDEWEVYDRVGVLTQGRGAPVDLHLTGAYNITAGSLDGEITMSHAAGPVRLIAAARALGSAYGNGETRAAIAGGFVWHVLPGSVPVTLAADVSSLVDRGAGEVIAWSGGVHMGLPHTSLAFGLHASNATTTTLQGSSVGRSATRWAFELNVPVEFVGFALGWFTPRERALETVEGDVDASPSAVVPIRRYAYAPAILRVRAGDVVEWVNEDAAPHTVTAENGAFDSGGMRQGERWRARFNEPGRYPYYCGPHPFMKAIVIVERR